MIYAVYRRASPDLPWSFACSADKKSVVQALVKDVEKMLADHGYERGEVKVVEFASEKDVKPEL